MTVYVEVVLFNNFAVDFALCICAQLLRNKKLRIARAVMASLIGAVVACFYAISPRWAEIVIKVLLAPIMTLIAVKIEGGDVKGKMTHFLRNIVTFCLLTYFTGGIVYGLSFAFKIDINSYITLGIVAMAICICIVMVYMFVRKKSKGDIMLKQVELVIGTNTYVFNGLCDSGNMLVDSFSGLPVVILSSGATSAISDVKSEGSICVNTVAGDEHMTLFAPDKLMIDGKQKQALCAISKQNFEEYDIILQNSLF